jgi:hypothetical protein
MALGTTNVSMSGIFSEVGKSTTTNLSLGELRFAANDIGNSAYAQTSSANNSSMGNFRSYDHKSMTFRYSAPFGYETYRDTSSTALGDGISLTNNGTSAGSPSGALDFDGSNDYSYFDGVGSGVAYKQNPSGYCTICFWINPHALPSANTNIITTDATGLGNNSPYKGFHFNLRPDGQIRPVRGDGTGSGSGDRRSFGTSWTLGANKWQLCAFMLSNSSNTASSSTNYSYLKYTGGESDGLSFLSGTGGSMSFDTGSGSTDALYLSMATNSRYFNGEFGHIWVFAERLTADDIQTLYESTADYYA